MFCTIANKQTNQDTSLAPSAVGRMVVETWTSFWREFVQRFKGRMSRKYAIGISPGGSGGKIFSSPAWSNAKPYCEGKYEKCWTKAATYCGSF
jgi:hypothetical protein